MLFLNYYFSFKSHRDKVQILDNYPLMHSIQLFQIPQGQSSNFVLGIFELLLFICFKSHRDKVQIRHIINPNIGFKVSNPIGTKFKFNTSVTCINCTQFQIPQGQSSNMVTTDHGFGKKCFKSHRDKVQISIEMIKATDAELFQIPQGQSSNIKSSRHYGY